MRIPLLFAILLAVTTTVQAETCTPPLLTEYPRQVTATAGHPFFLCFFFAGTPGTAQWYSGRSGDTSQPIAGAVTQCLVTSVHGSVEVWARLTNECGVVDSETIQVRVKSKPRAAGH